jgi:hypothetical protein
MWILADENARVISSLEGGGKLPNGTHVEVPEGFDPEHQHDWRLVDGMLVYDPEA